MKQNDFLKFLCRAPERMHKSFFFPLLHLQFNWNNFIQLFTKHPHIHTSTTHRHFFSLALPGLISFSPSLFLSVSLHVSVLLLYECTLTYSHACELTLKHSVTCPPFLFFVLGQYIKNCPHFSSCLSSESLSLCFLFPFCFLFFLVFSSLPILPSWQTCCDCASQVVTVCRTSKWWEADIFRIAAMASGIHPGKFYKWKFSRGGNWSNLNQIKIILSAGRVLNYRGEVMGVGGDPAWDRNHGDLSQV